MFDLAHAMQQQWRDYVMMMMTTTSHSWHTV
jgi:hypothetical protein